MRPSRRRLLVDGWGNALDEDVFGLNCWHGGSEVMARPHRHDDIEVNIVEVGELDYVFGGTTMRVREGFASLFWAAIPHQLVAGQPAKTVWLTIPMSTAQARGVPDDLLGPLLRGQQITTAVEGLMTAHFLQWERDMRSGIEELRVAALLEIEAWLRRLAHRVRSGEGRVVETASGSRTARVAAMADFIEYNFTAPIQVADVASAACINRKYAMVLFRNVVGVTIGAYLTERRIAEARRLLVSTDRRAADVGFAVGFGSESQFYASFKKACGESPASYRKRHSGLAEVGSAPPAPEPPADESG